MSIDSLRQQVEKTKNQYQLANAQFQEETENLKAIEERLENIRQAQHITQTVAQAIQQHAHKKIARVVTACLQTVFTDMDYEFKLRFDRKRNRTEAKPILIKDGHEIENPYDKTEKDNRSSESGGVLDIAGFTCQVAAIILSKPPIRPLLVMDEPFKGLSVEYRAGARQIIQTLAKDFGIQFLMVTYMEELTMGKVVEL